MWCQKSILWILWTAKKKNKWLLDGLKPELSIEAKIMKLILKSYEKTRVTLQIIMLGKI